jgi:uncharacterized membrane protein
MMGFWLSIRLYLAALAAFLVIDLTWLSIIAQGFYRKHLGHLMAVRTNWPAAVAFYLLFVLGLVIIAIIPGLKENSLVKAILFGALYGFFTYVTYDLTNLATLRDWPVLLTMVDIVWGTFLAASVTWVGFLVGNWLM